MEFTRFAAVDVLAGRYPFVQFDAAERWHQRLYRDRRVDLWLISWLPSQGTQLHDHGGSAGGFTVVRGQLTETTVANGRLHDISRVASDSVGFGKHYVHDVRNGSHQPAVSVHAYSPPLASMNFYYVGSDGRLIRSASVATEVPEPEGYLLAPAEPAA
jgi:hypothetical protein